MAKPRQQKANEGSSSRDGGSHYRAVCQPAGYAGWSTLGPFEVESRAENAGRRVIRDSFERCVPLLLLGVTHFEVKGR